MIDVATALAPPSDWTDTPEQAQIRACLVYVLEGRDPVATLKIASEMISMLRDQMLTRIAQVRREAAFVARDNLSVSQLVEESGQTRQTISRLLSEHRAYVEY